MSYDLTPTSGYLLGAILTDGPLLQPRRQRIVVMNVRDQDFAEATAEACFQVTGRRYVVAHSRKKPPLADTWRVQMTNLRLHDWVFDVTHDRTRIPEAMQKADLETQRHFLAGVMDGDGWVSIVKRFNKPGYSISSFCQIGVATTKPWINDLARLAARMELPAFGPYPYQRKKLRKDGTPHLLTHNLRFKTIPFVRAEIPLRLGRKADRLRRLLFLLESSEAIRLEPVKGYEMVRPL